MPSRSACIVFLLSSLVLTGLGPSGPSRAWWSKDVQRSLDRVEAPKRQVWEHALRAAPAAQRPSLTFLIEHMPAPDLVTLDPAFIIENVELALAARDAVPWGKDIPEAIFLNDVLPYVNLSERRDPWRAEFVERFLPRARACKTPGEAAHELNKHIFGELGVRYSTERRRADQSPAESIDTGLASCTGLSIILTDACRAVGVPARVVGIPNWTDKRGNHTWVEVWDGSTWRFVGAAEPHPDGLDRAWFTGDAALAQRDTPEHAIYALSYRRTGLEFPVVFDPEAAPVHAVNVTDRYAKPRTRRDDESQVRVRVIDASGARRAVAVTVHDPTGDGATFGGVSRDESSDTNDTLTFAVPKGRTFEVSARADGRAITTRIETVNAVHDVELVLTTAPTTDPAPAASD